MNITESCQQLWWTMDLPLLTKFNLKWNGIGKCFHFFLPIEWFPSQRTICLNIPCYKATRKKSKQRIFHVFKHHFNQLKMYKAAVSVQRLFRAVHSFTGVAFGTGPALMGPVFYTQLSLLAPRNKTTATTTIALQHLSQPTALLLLPVGFKQRNWWSRTGSCSNLTKSLNDSTHWAE